MTVRNMGYIYQRSHESPAEREVMVESYILHLVAFARKIQAPKINTLLLSPTSTASYSARTQIEG